jgi:hypothetical protein
MERRSTVIRFLFLCHTYVVKAAARRFSSWFAATYGDGNVNSVPGFSEAGFSEVLRTAAPNHTFVFVYLHSDLNQDADAFCRCDYCSVLPVVLCTGLLTPYVARLVHDDVEWFCVCCGVGAGTRCATRPCWTI